jgi:hypothetical protein
MCLYDSHALATRYMITGSFHEIENVSFPYQELHSSICTYLFGSPPPQKKCNKINEYLRQFPADFQCGCQICGRWYENSRQTPNFAYSSISFSAVAAS